jgi:hypothetical protein
MRKLLLIILIALNYSCEPKVKNDSETLEKVFAMSNFDIEIRTSGCFHGSEDYFTVDKENDGYILKSKKTNKSHLISYAKMDSLKDFLKNKIGKEITGGCTSSEYIRIGTIFNSIDYAHRHCSGIEGTILKDLLNYRELLEE